MFRGNKKVTVEIGLLAIVQNIRKKVVHSSSNTEKIADNHKIDTLKNKPLLLQCKTSADINFYRYKQINPIKMAA